MRSAIFVYSLFVTAPLLIGVVTADNNSAYPDSLVDYIGKNADRQVARFLEEDDFDDDTDENGLRTLGIRCNDDDKPCYPGLACTKVAIGSRCLPSKDCLLPKLQAVEATYNMTAMRAEVFANAGVTESELTDQMQSTERSSLVRSGSFQNVVAALNSVMDGPNKALTAISRECGYPEMSQEDWAGLSRQEDTSAGYIGLHLEAGLLFDGVLAFLSGDDANGVANQFCRACGGIEIGVSTEVSFVLGGVSPGGINDVQCLSFMFDVDFGIATYFGVAVGVGLTGKNFIEITIGLGFGIGAGVSVCGTLKTGEGEEGDPNTR